MNRKVKKYKISQEVLLRMLCLNNANEFVTNIMYSPNTGSATLYVTGDYVEEVPEGYEIEVQEIL